MNRLSHHSIEIQVIRADVMENHFGFTEENLHAAGATVTYTPKFVESAYDAAQLVRGKLHRSFDEALDKIGVPS